MNSTAVATRRNQVRWNLFQLVALTLAILAGSVFTGLVVGVGGSYAALAVVGALLFVAGMFLPLKTLVLIIFAVVYLAVGQLQYFARIDKAFWIPYLLGLFLYIRLLADSVKNQSPTIENSRFGKVILVFVGLFFLASIAASLIQGVAPLQWLVGGKEYFFLWSVLLAFVVGAFKPHDFERMLKFAPWFMALQLPAVLYQRFYIANNRLGSSTFDAVVGLFGGDPNGGGASGAMAIFSLIVIGFVLEGWRANAVSGRRAIVTIFLAGLPIVLAEVKFALVLVPAVIALVYGRDILRRPDKALLALLAAIVLTAGLLLVYQSQFTSDRSKQGKSLDAYVETIIERNTGTDFINFRTGEMGRVAAYTHWWDAQRSADVGSTLIGHGIGSTRIGTLVVGDLARQYRFKLGRSSLVLYLWEVGIFGATAILLALVSAVLTARRLSLNSAVAQQAWMLRGATIGLTLIVLSLPYNTDFADVAQIQVLACALIGYVIATGRGISPLVQQAAFKRFDAA